MNPIDVDVSAAVARALLERWTDERAQAREQAIDAARKLVSLKLGKLERADFEQLFKYFHADFHGGRATGDRFSQAFTGSLSNKLLEHITELNHWTERLWQARNDDEVAGGQSWSCPPRRSGSTRVGLARPRPTGRALTNPASRASVGTTKIRRADSTR